jgi:muramidase (phage lysozyme)
MANAFKGILAAGVVGSIAWAFREYQKGLDAQEPQFVITPAASTPAPQRSNSLFGTFLGNFAGNLFDSVPAPIQDAVRTIAPTVAPDFAPYIPPAFTPAATNGGGGTGQILAIIRRHESGGDYNIVWGGISAADQPPRPLTQMTIGQVLAWQDSIDRKYNSEAAGAYQILEDTLRGLYASAGLSTSSLFNRENQDRLGVALLERRGLSRYRRGSLNDVQFAQNLAMEWASFPAQTRDKRGRAATGQSYYAGDGLNASLTSKDAVLSAVRRI